MNTEITDTKEFRGWVLYDAECRLCTGMVGRLRGLLAARNLTVLPLQTPWVRKRLAMPERELLAEMRLLKPDGTVFGGADAFVEVCRYYQAGAAGMLAWEDSVDGEIDACGVLVGGEESHLREWGMQD